MPERELVLTASLRYAMLRTKWSANLVIKSMSDIERSGIFPITISHGSKPWKCLTNYQVCLLSGQMCPQALRSNFTHKLAAAARLTLLEVGNTKLVGTLLSIGILIFRQILIVATCKTEWSWPHFINTGVTCVFADICRDERIRRSNSE